MKSLDISVSPARAAGEPSQGWHCRPNSTQAQTFEILFISSQSILNLILAPSAPPLPSDTLNIVQI